MEAGRRWKDEDIPTTQWDLPHFLWRPEAELYGIQRIEYMPVAANSAPIEPHALHQEGTTSIDPAPIAGFSKNFASPLLPDFSASLSVKEVASRLRVCTATIYRLCAAGELRHFRVGASIRIREDDLAGYQTR